MTDDPTPELQPLMTSIGRLIYHWSLLEDALADDIRRLRMEIEGRTTLVRVRGSFSDRLREWRGLLSQKTRGKRVLAAAVEKLANEMEQLKLRRNLVGHDFTGAFPGPDDSEPFILCAPRDRGTIHVEPMRITLSQLNETIDAIDRCRQRIGTVAVGEGALADRG
jgi:hypothetical protein